MPTLSVRRYDYESLKAQLRPAARIVVVSCDSCARQSADLGGMKGLQGLSRKLAADGFDVVRRELLPVACSPENWQRLLADDAVRRLLTGADVLIPLACAAGVQRAGESVPGIVVLSVTETLGKGTFSPATGALLTEPADGVQIDIDDPAGIPLGDAAGRLGLHLGGF